MQYLIKQVSSLSAQELADLNLTGAPAAWPLQSYPYDGVSAVPSGFTVVTDVALAEIISENQSAYDAWIAVYNAPIPGLGINLWHGTTGYFRNRIVEYANVLTTDSNGRITVYFTQNGLSNGVRIFSSLVCASAVGFSSSTTDPLQAPYFVTESANATSAVFRCVLPRSQGILIGGTVVPVQYSGAGISATIYAKGIN